MSADNKDKMSFQEALTWCINRHLCFAAYRLPRSEEKVLVVQKDPELKPIDKKLPLYEQVGFLISPYKETDCYPSYLLHPDHVFKGKLKESEVRALKEIDYSSNPDIECGLPDVVSRPVYLERIKEIIEEINKGKVEKAVLSRVKLVEGEYIDMLPEIFKLLCKSYNNAFVHVFRAGDYVWIGATPEPLAVAKNGLFKTASVAGTRPFSIDNSDLSTWNRKERMEQENVTRFIEKVLADFNVQDYDRLGPYTKKAGNLLHLRTDFTFESSIVKSNLGDLVEALHPTSAVCGMPKQTAMDLIGSLETHDREYYAGYLGPVGIDGSVSLFVNLRCMKVFPDFLALYVGGGITADSNPEDEWQETEIKAETLLKVVNKIVKETKF